MSAERVGEVTRSLLYEWALPKPYAEREFFTSSPGRISLVSGPSC